MANVTSSSRPADDTAVFAEQMDEALRINAAARIRSLKIGFLCLSDLALMALLPCRWLSAYRPG